MFRIGFFVDDKKLAEALRSLQGVAIGAPEVQPVVNAVVKNGHAKPKGRGDTTQLFLDFAKKRKLDKFGSEAMKDFCREVGRAESSAVYYAKWLEDHGTIKRAGKDGLQNRFVVAK